MAEITKIPLSLLVDCATCESRVGAEELASKWFTDELSGDGVRVSILCCSVCRSPIVSTSNDDVDFDLAGDPYTIRGPEERVWPAPIRKLPPITPKTVRVALEEAQKCLSVQAFAACAVMCGKSLESLCKDKSIVMRSLADGIEQLRTAGIIDGRLYEWGHALREVRNIGAHSSDIEISRDDARDIYDFSIAIVDYVYVLNDKYEKFKQRQSLRDKASSQA